MPSAHWWRLSRRRRRPFAGVSGPPTRFAPPPAGVHIAQREQEPSIGEFFTTMDTRIRELLRRRVEPLVPVDRVEATVDLLRVLANGLVLTAVEHHDAWPPERQLAVLDQALAAYGL